MANTLLVSGANALYAQAGSVSYVPLAHCYNGATPNLTSGMAQVIWRSAGTLSNLSVHVTARTNTVTVNLRKNGTILNGVSDPVVAPTITGITSDTTRTATVAAGDKWDYNLSANTSTFSLFSCTFAATTNTVCRLVTFANSVVTTSTSSYCTLAGKLVANATLALAQYTIQKAGTLKNLYANVTSNSAGASSYIRCYKGAGTTVLPSISLNGAGTGFLEDTVNTSTVTAADLWCVQTTVAGGGSVTVQSQGVDFVSSSGDSLQATGDPPVTAGLAKNLTRYTPMGAESYWGTSNSTESNMTGTAFDTYLYSNFYVYRSDALGDSSTCSFRAATASKCTVTPTTAGTYGDTVSTYTASTSDAIDFLFTTGSTTGIHKITYFLVHANLASGPKTASFPETVTVGADGLKKWAAKPRSESAITLTETRYPTKRPGIATQAIGSVTDSRKKLGIKKGTEALGTVTEGAIKKLALHKMGGAADTISLGTDSLRKLLPRKSTEPTISLGADVLRKLGLKKGTEALGTITESLKKLAFHRDTEALGTVTDSVKKLGIKKETETLGSVTDYAIKKLALHKIAEALVTIGDALVGGKVSRLKQIPITEPTLAISESIIKKLALHKLTTEAIGTVSETLKRKSIRVFTESIGSVIEGTIKKYASHNLAQALGIIGEAIGRSRFMSMSISETTIYLTDFLAGAYGTAATIFLGDSVRKFVMHRLTEASIVIGADTVRKFGVKRRTEALGSVTETLKKLAFHKASDTISIGADVLKKLALHKFADTISFAADILRKLALHKRTEALGTVTDALRKLSTRTKTEALGTVTDSLKKLGIKKRTEALGTVADVLGRFSKHLRGLADTVTVSADALRKKRSIQLAVESLSLSETIAKRAYQHIADSLGSITDAIKKFVLHKITDALGTIGDVLDFNKIGGAQLKQRDITEPSLTISETIKKLARKTAFAEVLGSVTESIKKLTRKYRTEALGAISDVLGHIALHKRGISDGLGLITDQVKKKTLKVLTQAIGSVGDAVRKKVLLRISQSLGTIGDVLSKAGTKHLRPISEGLGTITDLLRKKVAHPQLLESIGISEQTIKKATRRISDFAISIGESLQATKLGLKIVSLVESPPISVSDVLHWVLDTQRIVDATKKLATKVIGEPLGDIGEILDMAHAVPVIYISEALGTVGDALSYLRTVTWSTLEALGFLETIKKISFLRRSEPTIPFSEVMVKVKHANRPMTEPSTTLGADVLRKISRKSISEFLAILESIRKYGKKTAILETIPPISDIQRKLSIPKTFSESLAFSESAIKKRAIKGISETIAKQEALIKKAIKKAFAEALGAVIDVIPGRKLQIRGITEALAINISEVLKRPKVVRVFPPDLIPAISESLRKRANKPLATDVIGFAETSVKHKRQFRGISDVSGSVSDIIGNFHRFVIKIKDTVGVPPGKGGKLHRSLFGRKQIFIQRQPERSD